MSGGILIEVVESGGSVIVEEVVTKVVEVYDFTVAGDVVPGSLGTTKGDIIVYAASGDPRRLGAGTDGLFLKANSSATLGLEYGTPPASGYNTFLNNTAVNLPKGASVSLDTSVDSAFKSSSTAYDAAALGVLAEAINSYATGLVATGGTIETGVLVNGNVARGDLLCQSGTTNRLMNSGSTRYIPGVIAMALSSYSGGGYGTVTALILPAGVASLPASTEYVKGVVELANSSETQTGTDNTRAVTPAGLQAKTASDTVIGLVELATDAETITGTDTTRAVTPANVQAKVSSETAKGIVELATSAETITGTDNTRAVHPAGLQAKTASETAMGIVELATSSEVSTGTDATRPICPDQLAGSTFGKRVVAIQVLSQVVAWTVGDGAMSFFVIPTELNGMNLVDADASLSTVSSSGTPTVQIARYRAGWVDMLSTSITIDANEYSSYTAATAPVINGSNDDVATGDLIRVDIDAAGTGSKGLIVYLTFQTP